MTSAPSIRACSRIPAGVINVVTGTGAAAGAHLVAHPEVDMVSFTGSTAVGKQVITAAAATVKRVQGSRGAPGTWSTGPCSTARPCRTTSTSWAIWRTTARSCHELQLRAVPVDAVPAGGEGRVHLDAGLRDPAAQRLPAARVDELSEISDDTIFTTVIESLISTIAAAAGEPRP